ncbi:MAG: Ca2+-binding RTX toxin-like protein [Verrucomicrobiales bacterium]|jgi:Ca2+-binding RTX toxin-like protein
MRRKLKHAFLGMALVAATVAAPISTTQAGAVGIWNGFSATSVPSGLASANPDGTNNSPAFTAATTNDLGGPGTDLFVSNHAEKSEWLVDWEPTAGVFADAIQAAGGFDSHGAAFSDIDGDGDDDLVETSGRAHDTRVFINDPANIGDLGAITGHGLEDNLGRGRTVLMVDIDDDGDMDALIVNLDRQFLTPDGMDENDPTILRPSELFLNDGDGTSWTKVADPTTVITDESVRYAHLTTTGPGETPVIVTSNSFSFAIDTVQTGSATLIASANPVNQTLGVDDNASNMRDIALGDLDGDLMPEWIVARQDDFLATDDVGATVPEPGEGEDPPAEGEPQPGDPIGDGVPDLEGELPLGIGQVSTSSLVSEAVVDILPNDDRVDNCRTVALADYDNDADIDIFGGCTMVESGQTQNVILLNDGAGNFTIGTASLVPATAALGTATVAITADFNDDGWIDTYVGGGYDSQAGEDFIFLNDGGVNNWLKVDLVGSNPDVMGAQVFAGTDKWQVRETGHRVHRGQDMKSLHFGLADQTAIAPLEIMWPDGTFERCAVAGINQTITVTQGSNDCVSQTKSGLMAAVDGIPDTSPLVPPLICNNLEVTVDLSKGEAPTAGDDIIRGTSGNDVINGLAGNDTICSLQGDDTINGGDGFDKIFAGLGNDIINGGTGNDRLVGGSGNDTINGDNGNDRIQGGDGVDTMSGGNGKDRIAGGNGNDVLRGGKFADELFGNLGRDQLFGEEGDDVLRGGAWIDTMDGGPQFDGCTLTDPGGVIETRVNCETGVFGL